MARTTRPTISTKILHELCSIPTAPFVESRVYEFVGAFVQARARRLSLSRDRFGNHLVTAPGDPKRPRLIFVAHTDHPGFIARRMIDDRTLDADVRGGLYRSFMDGAKVRFFPSDDTREVAGIILSTTPSNKRSASPARARIRVSRPIERGTAGMFDQGEGRIRGKNFHCRVCDDLAGAAAAMTMLDAHAKRPRNARGATVGVLLTRAEEEGFIGAIAAVREPKLLRKNDLVISIECSAEQPFAKQGNGVIVRVGDRISVFDSDFTGWITQQAETLAKRDRSFKYQRALMPGGACEGTVFNAHGYTTAAVCMALRNYHNMDRATGKIGPESVNVSDWRNMTKLFIRLASNAAAYERGMRGLRDRLAKRYLAFEKFL